MPEFTLHSTVFLVGFMGAGKTSVSRRLARICGAAAVDADVYLSRAIGMPVPEFISVYGIDAFRQQEHEVLLRLIDMTPSFIALGGGVVESSDNRELLKHNGVVVFLDVTAQEAQRRISDLSTRPLFHDVERAQQLNTRRRALYEEVADCTLKVGDKNVTQLSKEIIALLKGKGVLVRAQN